MRKRKKKEEPVRKPLVGIDQDGNEYDKIESAIQIIRAFAPPLPDIYLLAFSGGKDSQCIYHLAKRAGVPFEAQYIVTSADPPEQIRFLRENYPDVKWVFPRYKDGRRITMWNIIPKKGTPPRRTLRYCCAVLKETSGRGRITITGVRWEESTNRKYNHGRVDIQTNNQKFIQDAVNNIDGASITQKQKLILNVDNDESREVVESCYTKRRVVVNPIIDWTEEDVWEYLNNVEKVPHCSLYDEGFHRLGCIGCPMGGKNKIIRDFERWPKYRNLYIKSFERLLENRQLDMIVNREWYEGIARQYNLAPLPNTGSSDHGYEDASLLPNSSKAYLIMEHWLYMLRNYSEKDEMPNVIYTLNGNKEVVFK